MTTILDSIGWKATGLRNKLSDHLWERRLGIDTAGWQAVNQRDANPYATFAYSSILKILRRLGLGSGDVFIDIGCGKGRVVLCAATFDVSRVIGIDIDKTLCETAQANVARARKRTAPIQIINDGAQNFDYVDCNKFFLFNSFGAATFKSVLESIQRSLQTNPRTIRLAYVNPFHEALLNAEPNFRKYDQWQRRPWSGLKFDVSFWEGVPRAT